MKLFAAVAILLLVTIEARILRHKRMMPLPQMWNWEKNTFVYDTRLPPHLTQKIEQVMEEYHAHTCVNFKFDNTTDNISRATLDHYLGNDCGKGSFGRSTQGIVQIRCWTSGNIAHELGHGLGFQHTQLRNDRDGYIAYNATGNNTLPISPLYWGSNDDNHLVPYDYGSTMHYSEGSWYTSIDRRYRYTMGQRTDISFYDFMMVNRHYSCECPTKTSAICANGGVPNPRNCQTCNCPSGFGGATCTERPTTCGKVLLASSEWQNFTGSFEFSQGSVNENMETSQCVHWIKAPEGSTITVEVTEMVFSDYDWRVGNAYPKMSRIGIEMMVNDDIRMSGVRVSGTSLVGPLTTPRNLLPVRVYSNKEINKDTMKSYWNDIGTYTFRYKVASGPATTSTFPPSSTTTSTLSPITSTVTESITETLGPIETTPALETTTSDSDTESTPTVVTTDDAVTPEEPTPTSELSATTKNC